MDAALEPVDKLLAGITADVSNGEQHDAKKEFVFAHSLGDFNDPACLRWLAACAVLLADELEYA